MTYQQLIHDIIKSGNFDDDSPAKVVALAYFMGREAATKEICDAAQKIFSEQLERVNNCRYSKMAAAIQGNHHIIYNDDYAGNITAEFGSDETNLQVINFR